jgi:hypothetical protein
MKGMVFTELVEFVEDKFGFDVADSMLEASMLEEKGAYTQAANYSFDELVAIVSRLAEVTKIPMGDLIEVYGRHLFGRLVGLYPPMVANFSSSLPFIAQVDTFIHPEVKKLYPDADLPSFNVISLNESELVIDYTSNKPLMPLARGLMLGAADHFGERIEIFEDDTIHDTGQLARFTVKRHG